MRAMQSSNASGMYSHIGPFIEVLPDRSPQDSAVEAGASLQPEKERLDTLLTSPPENRGRGVLDHVAELSWRAPRRVPAERVWRERDGDPRIPEGPAASCETGVAHGPGLLHDARNLIGALGLYCDLLSMPGVLKPEHVHYADELRLLGSRSGALMERLMLSSLKTAPRSAGARSSRWVDAGQVAVSRVTGARSPQRPVNVRELVQRCIGLLGRVSGGRPIEVEYGAAATVPVMVEQEDVERILVNLVRNAAAAMADSDPAASIRIGVGSLQSRVGDARPWPLRRMRLTVEDSGCGMSAEQLDRLLRPGRAPARGGRGIGFQVVLELAASSSGELRMMSVVGAGTRVQIEWPMDAGEPCPESGRGILEFSAQATRGRGRR